MTLLETYKYVARNGIRGDLDVSVEHMMRTKKEGLKWNTSRYYADVGGLILRCPEAEAIDKEISERVFKEEETTWYVTDEWHWEYITSEYAVDSDGGVHFTRLTIYKKGT